LDGVRIWRHESGIALKINGKLTSVNNNPTSKRGNPSLYDKLNEVLLELGIKEGENEQSTNAVKDDEEMNDEPIGLPHD
jgi:hypothetical protein